jgi:hypothetical protein
MSKSSSSPNREYSTSVPQPGISYQGQPQQLQQQQPQIIYVAVPQQQMQQQHQVLDQKTGYPVQVTQQLVQPIQPTYQTSTPLALLGRYASPADCPACGQRAITRIAHVVGNATQ